MVFAVGGDEGRPGRHCDRQPVTRMGGLKSGEARMYNEQRATKAVRRLEVTRHQTRREHHDQPTPACFIECTVVAVTGDITATANISGPKRLDAGNARQVHTHDILVAGPLRRTYYGLTPALAAEQHCARRV